jgi:hypothetical protein
MFFLPVTTLIIHKRSQSRIGSITQPAANMGNKTVFMGMGKTASARVAIIQPRITIKPMIAKILFSIFSPKFFKSFFFYNIHCFIGDYHIFYTFAY